MADYVCQGDHKEVVQACSEGRLYQLCNTMQRLIEVALKDDPRYIKALNRRAVSNEVLDTWSSLTAAQEGGLPTLYFELFHRLHFLSDYEKLLTLVPASDISEVRAALNKVKPRAETAQKKEMGEMMDKLKGIGNNILGVS
jgi:hypothetical protein